MAKKTVTKKFKVVAIGGVTRDIMFYSSEGELINTGNLTKQKLLAFEYGAKILAKKLHFSFGGGASNVAASFSSLGLKTAIISRVGSHGNGRLVLENLRDKKIDASFVKKDKDHTGFSVVLTVNNSAKEHVLFAYRGANDRLRDKDIPVSKFETEWFYVSSLPKIGWLSILKKVVKQKRKLAWNPGSRQLSQISRVKKILPKTSVLLLNRDEALEFKKLKNTKSLLKYIWNLGPEIVVITDGEKGAYVYDGVKYYFMRAKKTKNVDTVGVGDAFNSAFVSGLIYKKDIKTALKWGINNSASVISKIGAQNGLLTKRGISR